MSPRIRRGLVAVGVVASLALGVVSIQVAAALTAAAAPPPAPPISMSELQARLAAEQARAESLQQQLDDLLGVTTQLTDAIQATEDQVKTDGLTAAELRSRLKIAQDRLNLVNKLLKDANKRLKALGAVVYAPPPVSGGGSGGGSGSDARTTDAPADAATDIARQRTSRLRCRSGAVASSPTGRPAPRQVSTAMRSSVRATRRSTTRRRILTRLSPGSAPSRPPR